MRCAQHLSTACCTSVMWLALLDNSYVQILFLAPYHEKSRNAYITVSEDEADIFYTSGYEDNLCGYHDGVLNQYYTLITCNSAITGQFVQIQLYTTAQLHFYEVEVHGV